MIPYRDDNPIHGVPFITVLLIFLNLGIYFFLTAGFNYEGIVNHYGFVPSEKRLITYGTSMFLHGGMAHLIFNMWYLWLFGDNLEDELGHLGFLVFYLMGGIISMFLHDLMTFEPALRNVPAIGASGAISAVMGGYVTLFPHAQIRMFWFLLYTVQTFKISAVFFLGFWFLQQLISGGAGALAGVSTGVAYWAHIGGFIFGILVGWGVRGIKTRYYLS